MTEAGWRDLAVKALGSPRLSAALTTLAIGVAACTFLWRRLLGWPGLLAMILTVLVLMGLSILARRRDLEWRGLLPISLLCFLGWSATSLIWSEYRWATLGSLGYLVAFTLMGMYVALLRDTIQILRSIGDVLRVLLGASLVLEVFSGIIIDSPIPMLAISGRIAELGPISGLFSTRNQLGLLAIIAVITFVIELRTRSVRPLIGWTSLVLAAACIYLTRSPIVFVTAIVVGVASGAIYAVRRVRPQRRQLWQFALLGFAVVSLVVAWVIRSWLVERFNATGELNYRLRLWQQLLDLIDRHPLEGWGWVGRWPTDIFPFVGIVAPSDRIPSSASNAFLDVWLQLGILGVVVFVGMAGLAFVRSWLLAGRRRSVVYAWPAAVLVALIVSSVAESMILHDVAWLLFVICCTKASQELSWRQALSSPDSSRLPPAPPTDTAATPIQPADQ